MRNNISSTTPYGVTFDKLRSDKQYVISYSLQDYETKITIDHINQCIKNNIESVDKVSQTQANRSSSQ